MAERKITKKDNFATLLTIKAVAENQVLVDFIKHEIELLDKKGSSTKKKENAEMQGLISEIVAVLESQNKACTISEIQKVSDVLKEASNQRISALLKKLVDADRVIRTKQGKLTFFKLA